MARRKRDTVREAVLELGSDEAVMNRDELDEQLAARWGQARGGDKRPVDHVCPVIFVDCIVVKIRDGQVANRPIYTVIGVSVDGERDILGLWAGTGGEGRNTGGGTGPVR